MRTRLGLLALLLAAPIAPRASTPPEPLPVEMSRLLAGEPPVAEGTLVAVVADVRVAVGHCTERKCGETKCCNACGARLQAFDPEVPRGWGEGLTLALADGAITWSGHECDIRQKAPWAPGRYRLTARAEYVEGTRGLRIVSREAVAPDARPVLGVSVAALRGGEAALMGRRLRVWGRLEAGPRSCTKIRCVCCNRCTTPLRLVSTDPGGTESLTVFRDGHENVCPSRECDPEAKCHPDPTPAWFAGELRRLPEGGFVFDLDDEQPLERPSR